MAVLTSQLSVTQVEEYRVTLTSDCDNLRIPECDQGQEEVDEIVGERDSTIRRRRESGDFYDEDKDIMRLLSLTEDPELEEEQEPDVSSLGCKVLAYYS